MAALQRPWDEDDVLAANLLRERFQAFQILDIGGGGMIWGGLTFYPVHVDFLNRQALYYFESFNDIVGPAIPLPVFCTAGDINSKMYDTIDEYYDAESSVWTYGASHLVSEEDLAAWRDKICGKRDEKGERIDL